jgi:serine/threonine protein kinase
MSSSTSVPGARIGKYRLLEHIATGGMGMVYKAVDESLGRIVALKVLAPDLTSNTTLIERFIREGRHAARLSHKNIVTLFESDEADGHRYLAMEYIEGFDLATYIERKGQLDPEEARRLLIQAAKALEHAFAQGVTHRDIKPSNFLLANDEGRCRVKLTDFGLARLVNDSNFRVTRADTTVGTVDYISPEQARDSAAADIRSDIYSLGCTFYHMLAGHPPFSEGGLAERVYKHIAADPPDIRRINPQVPAAMWAVLKRMLAKAPDTRYQTPTELIAALRALVEPAAEEDSSAQDSDSGIQTVPAAPRTRPAPPLSPVSMPAASEEPAPKPKPKKKKGRTTVPDFTTVPDPPDVLGITPEQRSAAAGQYTHATEVIRNGSDTAYALQLLLSSCKLDPTNFIYRKMLREVGREAAGGKKSGWLGTLTNLPARGRVRAARGAGEHRKVLELGEELLTRQPDDVATQIDMADAAEALHLPALAVWLLEEARLQAPTDVTILKALARVYERQKQFGKAISIWERVRDADPSDPEASTRIRDLSASDTIARGKFKV